LRHHLPARITVTDYGDSALNFSLIEDRAVPISILCTVTVIPDAPGELDRLRSLVSPYPSDAELIAVLQDFGDGG